MADTRRGTGMAVGVAVSAFLIVFTGPGMFMGCSSLLLVPMAEGLGENVASVSVMYTLMTVSGCILSLLYFKIERRLPMRVIVGMGVGGMAAAFLLIAIAEELAVIYAAAIFSGTGMVFCGFVVAQGAISRWFVKKRPLVNSLASSGGGLVGIVMTPIVMGMITEHGYRSAAMFLAGLTAAIGVAVVLLMRDAPAKYGLLPYGADDAGEDSTEKKAFDYGGLSIKEALRTKELWLICTVFLMMEMVWRGVSTQSAAMIVSKGYAQEDAVTYIQVFYAVTTLCRLTYGLMESKLGFRRITALYSVFTMCGLTFAALSDSEAGVYAFLVGTSFTGCVVSTYAILALTRVFGAKDAPGLNGIANVFLNAGGAISPIMLSGIYVATGSYSLGLLILAVLIALYTVISWIVCGRELSAEGGR